MSSLYAKYIQERTHDQIIETEYGFVTYRFVNEGKTVYIVDIYVLPEHRKQMLATSLANQVAREAKERGCVDMIGTVVPSAKGSTTSVKVLLGYGMSINSAAHDVVVFRKEL